MTVLSTNNAPLLKEKPDAKKPMDVSKIIIIIFCVCAGIATLFAFYMAFSAARRGK